MRGEKAKNARQRAYPVDATANATHHDATHCAFENLILVSNQSHNYWRALNYPPSS